MMSNFFFCPPLLKGGFGEAEGDFWFLHKAKNLKIVSITSTPAPSPNREGVFFESKKVPL